MAKGIIIKYRIAEFIPWAGFSPSCMEVFVQTAHWACRAVEINKAKKSSINMFKICFICVHKGTAAARIGKHLFNRN